MCKTPGKILPPNLTQADGILKILERHFYVTCVVTWPEIQSRPVPPSPEQRLSSHQFASSRIRSGCITKRQGRDGVGNALPPKKFHKEFLDLSSFPLLSTRSLRILRSSPKFIEIGFEVARFLEIIVEICRTSS